jgi:geranylgeranyl reductase family protein
VSAGSEQIWDLVVVGAGPGGAAAAFFAARRGLRVLLLERRRLPHDKVCGEGIGGGAASTLREMGVLERLMADGAGRATGFGLCGPSGGSFRYRDTATPGALPLLVVPRPKLHTLCVEAALAAGATLRDGEAVAGCEHDGERVRGVVTTRGERIPAQLVVGADGVHSRVRRTLPGPPPTPMACALGLRAHYTGLRSREQQAFFVFDRHAPGTYLWCFPLPDGRANVGVGIYHPVRRAGASPAGLLRRYLEHNAFTRELLQGGEPLAPPRGWPLPAHGPQGSGVASGALLVGDANGFVDPLTGEGIHMALSTGRIAGEVAADALAHRGPDPGSLEAYPRRWRRELAGELRLARGLRELLRRWPRAVDHLVELGHRDRARAVVLGEVLAGLRPKRALLHPGWLAAFTLALADPRPADTRR